MNKKFIWLTGLAIVIIVILIFSLINLRNRSIQVAYNPTITNQPKELNENLKNSLSDLIKVESPLPNEIIVSPFKIKGQARGNWFFEASFPIKLLDGNGNQVTLDPSYVMASQDWMTTDFVDFETTVNFSKPVTSEGKLILQKDNPSGLPEFDAELVIPIKFE